MEPTDNAKQPMEPEFLTLLGDMLAWCEQANSRLAFEMDDDGNQFGGNPYCNPLFRRARLYLETHYASYEDD